MKPLESRQILNLVNTDQVYRAWLSSQRESLAVALRRHASRNRRVGLGTISPPVAGELRQSARQGAAITSHHALYAYATLAVTQLETLDLSSPITVTPGEVTKPVVCIDQFGFAVLLHILDPVDYVAHADSACAQIVKSMIDSKLLLPRFPPQPRS